MLRLKSAGSERLDIKFDGRFFESPADCGTQISKEDLPVVWTCAEAPIASTPSRAMLIVKWSAMLKGLRRWPRRAFIFLTALP